MDAVFHLVCIGAAVGALVLGVDRVPWPGQVSLEHPWRIDPNIASEVELRLLPGIGLKRSRSIMEMRIENGPFPTAGSLVHVPGLSPRIVRQLLKSGMLDVPRGPDAIGTEP